MLKQSRHRVNSRLTTVQIELQKQLEQLSSGIIYSKLDFGVSGHFADRICYRSYNVEVALSNTRYLVSNLLKKHFCQLVYEAELKSLTGDPKQMVVIHRSKLNSEQNVAIGFNLWANDLDEVGKFKKYMRLRCRTYMVDYWKDSSEVLMYEV
jgi:hypothetical protein